MNLHSLKNTPGAKHRRKIVGRGESSGKGKTSGKGNKGQMARKGHKHKAGFEGGQMRLVRRIPKRGFTSGTRRTLIPINVENLMAFSDGAEVTWAALKACGLASGPADGIKILGHGDLKKKLIVKANAFSSSARAKIEAAGGVCEAVVIG
jgi:large subunit ribosomal protein L15